MAQTFDVVIKTTKMGEGDDALTENLMNGFVHTLAQKDKLPKHILLYGTGVKLTCKGSACIDDLKAIADKGVEILSCGICLNYYELSDNLEVGRVTTMGEVIDILSQSDYVVDPQTNDKI